MARTARITENMLAHARKFVQEAETARELKAGLSVILPKACNINYAETAQILGVGVATIVRMQRENSRSSRRKTKPEKHLGESAQPNPQYARRRGFSGRMDFEG